jgi:hypothetical protein
MLRYRRRYAGPALKIMVCSLTTLSCVSWQLHIAPRCLEPWIACGAPSTADVVKTLSPTTRRTSRVIPPRRAPLRTEPPAGIRAAVTTDRNRVHNDEGIWIHAHVPKCGGTTLQGILRRNFGDGVPARPQSALPQRAVL